MQFRVSVTQNNSLIWSELRIFSTKKLYVKIDENSTLIFLSWNPFDAWNSLVHKKSKL